MAVKVDLTQLQGFYDKLDKLDTDKFCRDCVNELAGRLLSKVIKRTPVGVYPPETGKLGGTLRRGWTDDPPVVTRTGDTYEADVSNPVSYAPYVEYGHRTRNHKGWVEGKYMLTDSENELEPHADTIVSRKWERLLATLF
jgi:hypothetical protein